MQHIVNWVHEYGLLFVFASVLVDLGGLPLPCYPALIIAGAASLTGGAPAPAVLATAVSAAVLADSTWYGLAARFGSRVLALLCKVSLSPDSCVRQTQSLFERIGPRALMFAKFIPGLGNVTVALCGLSKVPLALFLALDLTGIAIYLSIPVVLGRLFFNAIESTIGTLARLGRYGLMLLIAVLIGYLAVRWIQRRTFIRRLRMDRISVAELTQMLDAGQTPVILDVRTKDVRQRDGIIPGAIAAHPSDLDAVLERYAHDAEVVVYCSCPNEASAALAARHLQRAGFRKIRPLLGGIEAWTKAGRPIERPAGSGAVP